MKKKQGRLRNAQNIRRIVVKLGTNILSNKDGSTDYNYLSNICSQIAELKSKGKEIMIVTSGAMGAAMGEFSMKGRPESIPKRQALAGIGQSILMQHYKDIFTRYKIPVCQVLLTYDVFKNKTYAKNLRNSMKEVFKLKAIPIFNENDPISIEEVDKSFGDNDIFSAMLTNYFKADLLVILTNVEGLCDKDPNDCKNNKYGNGKKCNLIPVVEKITKEIENIAGSASWHGLGGMKSKVEAAKIATRQCDVIVAHGIAENVLIRLINGESVGTLFKKTR